MNIFIKELLENTQVNKNAMYNALVDKCTSSIPSSIYDSLELLSTNTSMSNTSQECFELTKTSLMFENRYKVTYKDTIYILRLEIHPFISKVDSLTIEEFVSSPFLSTIKAFEGINYANSCANLVTLLEYGVTDASEIKMALMEKQLTKLFSDSKFKLLITNINVDNKNSKEQPPTKYVFTNSISGTISLTNKFGKEVSYDVLATLKSKQITVYFPSLVTSGLCSYSFYYEDSPMETINEQLRFLEDLLFEDIDYIVHDSNNFKMSIQDYNELCEKLAELKTLNDCYFNYQIARDAVFNNSNFYIDGKLIKEGKYPCSFVFLSLEDTLSFNVFYNDIELHSTTISSFAELKDIVTSLIDQYLNNADFLSVSKN